MPAPIRPLIAVLIFFCPLSTRAQIKWDVIPDTITLTPTIITTHGTVSVKEGNSLSVVVTGIVELNMKDKTVLFIDGKNLYQFKPTDLVGITLDDYSSYAADNLFKNSFADSINYGYRRLLYPNLSLNEISFSMSKRVEYGIENSVLVLKNQKKLHGKLCYVDLNNIVILGEDGEIISMKDGDFNFLEIENFKGFSCRTLYNYIFPEFKEKLEKIKTQWKEEIAQSDLEKLISILGPFTNITNISADKKMITWKKNKQAYYIDINALNIGLSSSKINAISSVNSNTSLFGIASPLFYYGNSYRNTDISLSENKTAVISNLNSQSGVVVAKDEGYTIAVIQDSGNKISQTYQENYFTDLKYGSAFRFINF